MKYSRINGQRPTYEVINAINYIKRNMFITEMLNYVKFLEYGMRNFDKSEGTMCHKVVIKITLLYGVKDELYYKDRMTPMIHSKYNNLKSNSRLL